MSRNTQILMEDNSLLRAILISYLLLNYLNFGRAAPKGYGGKGEWKILLNNVGIVAMHMTLTHYNTVIMFDQRGADAARFQLRRRFNGKRCKGSRYDLLDPSCYAQSVEYDVSSNKIRPLDVESNAWSSSGSMLSNGTLIQMGGFGSGSRRIRFFNPCGSGGHCDWREGRKHLYHERWYASSLRLPEREDRVIVVGGSDVFTYEFVPKRLAGEKSFRLPFLQKTYNRNEGGNNLYPIIHLSSDAHLFIFANRDSILFNYKRNRVAKKFPRIPGKGSRSYPSSGSSVLLPIHHKHGFKKVEVMICGGAGFGAFTASKQGRFLKGLSSCGRMVITGNDHRWKMENMPGPRLMNDMIVLPNGRILIINGVRNGCAGLNFSSNPVLEPYLYNPKKPSGHRFTTLRSTKVARMFHSSALLLPDGRVLVAGSNPNRNYTIKSVEYPTELRLQAFTPPNMAKEYDHRRPYNLSVHKSEEVGFGEDFSVEFMVNKRALHSTREIVFAAYATPFNTHSISMNQRMLILKRKKIERGRDGWVSAVVEAPPAIVAPSGYYMLSVVNNGIPSRSKWVRFMHK